MSKIFVSDLETHEPKMRRTQIVAMSLETETALSKLTNLYATKKSFTPKNVPLTTREYERAFRDWMASPPPEIHKRAMMISLGRSYEAAVEYFRDKFAELNPELVPVKKIGRPDWYIPPVTEQRLLQGEVIAMLINIAGEELKKQLMSVDKKAA